MKDCGDKVWNTFGEEPRGSLPVTRIQVDANPIITTARHHSATYEGKFPVVPAAASAASAAAVLDVNLTWESKACDADCTSGMKIAK